MTYWVGGYVEMPLEKIEQYVRSTLLRNNHELEYIPQQKRKISLSLA